MTNFRYKGAQDFKLLRLAFTAHCIQFFAIFGTALGAVREGNFIEGDDDIDLAVLGEIPEEAKEHFHDDLKKLGFDVSFQAVDCGGRTLARKETLTAIHWLTSHGNAYILRHVRGGLWVRILKRYLPQIRPVKFLGSTILVPFPPEPYLEATYGKNWENPIKGKHANPVMPG